MSIVLRSGMNVGAMSAENDERFLEDCFIETEALNAMRDIHSNKCILLGRTGSGKSACLLELEKRAEHAIRITPDSLSLARVIRRPVPKRLAEVA